MSYRPSPRCPRRQRSPWRAQDGTSLVEVLVATLITSVGLVGTFSLIDGAQAGTSKNRAREGAVALQREVVEAARAMPYDQLAPASLLAGVQARPGLGDSAHGSAGWTLRRRGLTYTATLGTCAVDDPRDGLGAHPADTFCASGAAGTSAEACAQLLDANGSLAAGGASGSSSVVLGDCGHDVNADGVVDGLTAASATVCAPTCGTDEVDASPTDYKRVVNLVSWKVGAGTRYVLQTTTIANPGMAGAPAVASMTQPDTITSASSIPFTLAASKAAAAVQWSIDGTTVGSASGSGTSFGFTWALGAVSDGDAPAPGEVLDGSYVVGAKAFDQDGQSGAARSSTVEINRRAPFAPQQLEAGRSGDAINFAWTPSKEGDVTGYRVFRQPAEGPPILACTSSGATACQAAGQPADPALVFYAVALDRAPDGSTREGTASSPVTVTTGNSAPAAAPSIAATPAEGGTQLAWTASSGDPDDGDAVDHYVIYRDGEAYADRYDRTGTGEELTFLDKHTNGEQHDYWVAAVDTQMAESTKTGPVRR